ncbi:MAG: hypothetical protein U9N59_01270 [Campylobacterota bacterium]|nr:hypothetical protein [Campylobacterota bacterium]
MIKRSIYLFYILGGLVAMLIIQSIYLFNTKSTTTNILNQKLSFVKITGLPDLAIATEASYTRHRSLADIFSIYKDDGNLREYFPTTFTYNHSTLLNNTPSRITTNNDKK